MNKLNILAALGLLVVALVGYKLARFFILVPFL